MRENSEKLHLFNKLLISPRKEEVDVKKMVKIKSPVRLRDLEGTLGVLFKSLVARCSKRELLDTEKMVAINLKIGESTVLMDRNDDFWELSRNGKGQYRLKRLNGKKHKT